MICFEFLGKKYVTFLEMNKNGFIECFEYSIKNGKMVCICEPIYIHIETLKDFKELDL